MIWLVHLPIDKCTIYRFSIVSFNEIVELCLLIEIQMIVCLKETVVLSRSIMVRSFKWFSNSDFVPTHKMIFKTFKK